ncbi:MAG TPA: hypothetical protein VFV33_07840 [Gemmatimonadaceae bacterium]|nr:hypothetical protein [Gemmatimonadaceae bacterium]
MRSNVMRILPSTMALAWAALVAPAMHPATARAQERNLTLIGRGTVESERGLVRDVREVRFTLERNNRFSATLLLRDGTIVVRGFWRRPGLGNVDRIELQEAERAPVRGEGTLVYADRDGMIPRRLSLSWSGRAGEYRVEVEDRDVRDDDRPEWPDRPGGWSAGAGERVDRNIDARAEGDGFVRMSGVRGGAFADARVRIGTGGDAIIAIDAPTKGEIRARVQEVRGRRVQLRVRTIFGYAATGTLTVQLRDADEVQRLDGDGAGERGAWSLDFRGRRKPNDWPRPGDDWPDDGGWGTMDRDERGRGTLTQDVGPTLALSRARVVLDDDRRGRIELEARRERVRIEGRWAPVGNGRVELEIQRINDRRASGRVTIRREGRSFATIDGDGRTGSGRFSFDFTAR